MRLIFKHENMMTVHSMKNLLAIEGIESMVKNEHGHSMGAEFGLSNTLMELWLLEDSDYDKAQTIIEKQKDNSIADKPWTCSSCGEINEGNFTVCWNCQNTSSAE